MVDREPRFKRDLFKGTAEYYDRFRPPYPSALLDDLRARVPLGDSSRLLDLACGTGQIAVPLAGDVAEVWAVDQEAEAVEFGKRKSEHLGIANIRWITATVESVALDGSFDLATIGNAFHRLDRDAIASRLVEQLAECGCVALLWSATPWRGDELWQTALHDTLERWVDAIGLRDRVPEGWEQVIDQDPHEQVLRRAGLSYEGSFEYSTVQRWTIDMLIGFVYSTSFLNRAALGPRVEAFESDLRMRLLATRPDGVFEQDLTFMYDLARRADPDANY